MIALVVVDGVSLDIKPLFEYFNDVETASLKKDINSGLHSERNHLHCKRRLFFLVAYS